MERLRFLEMRLPIARVMLIGAALAVAIAVAQPSGSPESYLGNLAPIARSIQAANGFALDYDHRGSLSLEDWRRRGRTEVDRTLGYQPRKVPLDLQVRSRVARDGYELRRVDFAASPHYRVPALLLVPTRGRAPFPGVVALHDHGGYFYHGKEKLVEIDDEPAVLTEFKQRYYGGASWASKLAQRGFVVLVTDAFYWGDRRLQYADPPEELRKRLEGLQPGTTAYIQAMNSFLRDRVAELNTWLGFAGTSWLGIVAYDDRRSVDLLASLPEVDSKRIGAAGLSGGGYRATYLAGMDSRVRAAVITGWMTSLPTTLDLPYSTHSGLFDAFGLHRWLDHPDVASLGAPGTAIFVQNCGRDRLFTRAGMDAAAEKLRHMYADQKHPERFQVKVYDVPHQFNLEMQAEAFAWLERWLR